MSRIVTTGPAEIIIASRYMTVKTADTTITHIFPRRIRPQIAPEIEAQSMVQSMAQGMVQDIPQVTVNAQTAIVNIVKRSRPKVKELVEQVQVEKVEQEQVQLVEQVQVEQVQVEKVQLEQEPVEIVEIVEPEQEPEKELEKEPELLKMYSPSEVASMNDLELEEKFIKLTGIYELPCSECSKSSKSISTSWMYSIRKRCLKEGLHKDIKIPKTCDRQSKRNDERNDINNKYHGQMKKYRKNPARFTIEDIKKWEEERVSELKKIGVKSRPSKHVL